MSAHHTSIAQHKSSQFTGDALSARPFRLGEAVQRAFTLAGLKQDAVAEICGKDAGQFSKELCGRPNCRLDFDLLMNRIDDHAFWLALLAQIAHRHHLAFQPTDVLMVALARLMVETSEVLEQLEGFNASRAQHRRRATDRTDFA